MPRLDHVTIDTRDAPRMIGFFKTVLGVEEGYRPPFPSPGHWLYLDDRPVIHLSLTSRSVIFHPASSTMPPSAFTNSPRRWSASRRAAIATNIMTSPTRISAKSSFTAPRA